MSQSQKFAELLGIMYGDGCLSNSGGKHLIYISGHKVDDFEYHQNNTKFLFNEVFKKKIKIELKDSEQTLFIRFSDKEIYSKFRAEGLSVGRKYDNLRVPRICQQDSEFFSFVRGIFDTDGCIILSKQHKDKPYYPRIEITSKSKLFLREIFERLKGFGFYGSVSHKGKEVYRLELPGFRNLELWKKKIGSSNPNKQNKINSIREPSRNFYK